MKKKLLYLLFVAGTLSLTSLMFPSCSSSDPDIIAPETGNLSAQKLIDWGEESIDGGSRGVGIKITSNDFNNFAFECTPGDNVQSYKLDVYPLCTLYNYLLNNKVDLNDKDKIEDAVMKCIYNAEGNGGYTFNEKSLGDNFKNTEFDWGSSQYRQFEIVPDADYLIVTVGCNDEGGAKPADMKICHVHTKKKDLIGNPAVSIDVNTGYKAASISYIPNDDCKYFCQFCTDKSQIDEFTDAFGERLYIDFLRQSTKTCLDAKDEEHLKYYVDFGYTANSDNLVTVTTIALDENRTPGKYTRKDFHLKQIPDDAKDAECSINIDKTGATLIDVHASMGSNCRAVLYRTFTKSEWNAIQSGSDEQKIACARQIDSEGWGIANDNYNAGKGDEHNEDAYGLTPNTDYYLVYIGRNGYHQLTDLKAIPFKTKPLVTDRPQDCKATASMTVLEKGRTDIKFKYSYTGESAMFYHQYIMTPDLLNDRNAMIEYLMSDDSNTWVTLKNTSEDYTWTGMDPQTKYTFAYVVEDWDGVLSEVKTCEVETDKIVGGANPTMELNSYMSDLGNFTVDYHIVKDVTKFKYMMVEDTYSISGNYSYNDCMAKWKEDCLELGIESYNSGSQSNDLPGNPQRVVALCLPWGEKDGEEFVGDLYVKIYDKDKGIITDLSQIFKDAPKTSSKVKSNMMKGMISNNKRRVVGKDIVNIEKNLETNTNSAVKTVYFDMKKLGKSPR